MRAGGYMQMMSPDGVTDGESITCNHCNRVVMVKANTPDITIEQSGWCLKCMRPLCARCADRGNCVPFEKKLEQYEQRSRLLAAL